MADGGSAAQRTRTRARFVSLPNPSEMQLPRLPSSGLLPLLGEVATPRDAAGGAGDSCGGGSTSPTAFGSGQPAGAASPMLYLAPLPTSAPLAPQLRQAVSFVAGGLLQSMSAGRLAIAASPRAPSPSAPSPQPPAKLEDEAGALALRAPGAGAAALHGPTTPSEYGWLALEWLIRFTLHIVLLAMFESLFFFVFVSASEDEALQKLVGGYVDGTLNSCPSWNASSRALVTLLASALVNQTQVNAAGAAAEATRNAYNGGLLVRSWVYFGGLLALLVLLCAIALCARRKMPWGHILAENVVLIVLLGLYELLFFSTIVLKYQAVSGAELDRRIVNQFYAQCTNSSWVI